MGVGTPWTITILKALFLCADLSIDELSQAGFPVKRVHSLGDFFGLVEQALVAAKEFAEDSVPGWYDY